MPQSAVPALAEKFQKEFERKGAGFFHYIEGPDAKGKTPQNVRKLLVKAALWREIHQLQENFSIPENRCKQALERGLKDSKIKLKSERDRKECIDVLTKRLKIGLHHLRTSGTKASPPKWFTRMITGKDEETPTEEYDADAEAAELDDGGDDEEPEEEQDDDEEEEEDDEDDEDDEKKTTKRKPAARIGADPKKYTFGVHEESGTIWRKKIGKEDKEPGVAVDQPNAAPEAAVLGVWPDGMIACVDEVTIAELNEMMRDKIPHKMKS